MGVKRRKCLLGTSFFATIVWTGYVLAAPAVASATRTTSLSTPAAILVPHSSGKVDWRNRRKARKTRSDNLVPSISSNSRGKDKGKSTVPIHPHITPLMRLQDIVRRRLRHSLCALPFVAQKAGVDDDTRYKSTAKNIHKRPGTRFILRFPDEDVADEMWQHMRFGDEVPFNHDCVGMTKPSSLVSTATSLLGDRNADGDKRDAVPVTSDYSLDKYCWPNSDLSDANAKTKGWRILRYRSFVGHGEECYKRVSQAVLDWEFATDQQVDQIQRTEDRGEKAMGIIRARERACGLDTKTTVRVQSIPLGLGGRRMVTYTECQYGIDIRRGLRVGLPTFYAVNPVASVYDIVDESCSNGDMFTSTSYATVGDHLLAGEERVTVILRQPEGEKEAKVHVEILSRSRPAPSLAGRLVWPFIGKMQSGFFKAELDHFIEVGRSV